MTTGDYNDFFTAATTYQEELLEQDSPRQVFAPVSNNSDSENSTTIMGSTSRKDKLKLYTSKDWVSEYRTDHVDVEYTKKEIFDSDDDASSTAPTVVGDDEAEEMKDADAAAGATTPKAVPEKKKAPIDFMAEYNAMFAGADGKKKAGAAPPAIPPPAKLTTAQSSGVLSFPSLSMGPSMSLIKSGDGKTGGGTLDSALIGTSLDLMKSDGSGISLLPGVTKSMDLAATAAAEAAVAEDAVAEDAVAGATAPAVKQQEASAIEQAAAKVLGRSVAKPVEQPTEPKPAPKTPAKKRRRPRKKKPEPPKDYIEGQPTEIDVLLGRGGRSNHWAGNKRYRQEVHNLQHWYKSSAKNEKTDLSQCLVNYVHAYGGRFLKLDDSNQRWYVVPNLVARRKASQALREHMTQEEREAFKAARKARLDNGDEEDHEPMEEEQV